MGKTPEVSDDQFQSEVLDASVPVLVDFWAPWCGPCRMLGPTIDQLADENTGSAKVVKVNVDIAQNSAAAYGIENIPTLLFFKGGQVVDRMQGIPPKSKIQAALDAAKG